MEQTIDLPPEMWLSIRADCQFVIYYVLEGKRTPIGPPNTNARVWHTKPQRYPRRFEVVYPDGGLIFQEFLPAAARVEDPDPTPVEVPLHFKRPPTLQEEIQRFVRQEVSQFAQANEYGTFEEEDDFTDDDDEGAPLSQYQEMTDEVPQVFNDLGPRKRQEGPQPVADPPTPPTSTKEPKPAGTPPVES